jgi:copper resistance protein B
VRHDFQPGPSQTFAGVGVIGLAPYRFEIEASAFIGEGGQATARLQAEYEVLLTNRLILQPLVEVDLYGETDERLSRTADLRRAEGERDSDTLLLVGVRTWF